VKKESKKAGRGCRSRSPARASFIPLFLLSCTNPSRKRRQIEIASESFLPSSLLAFLLRSKQEGA